MKSTFLSKKILAKFIAVVTSLVLVLCVAPISDVLGVVSNASAETPVYDDTLGSYTVNGSTLTATPYEGAGFRGWFKNDGTEVSYKTTYTLPAGESASDYVPVFYNFNLIKNGGFEEYANGTNLKSGVPADEIWEGTTDTEIAGTGSDWTKSTVSTNRARTGSKSLALESFHNCSYKEITGLEPNTQYTLTFYFNIASGTDNFMKQTYVVDGDVTESQMIVDWRYDEKKSYLAKQIFGNVDGVCAAGEWKQAKMTFYTGDKTSVKLLIYYSSNSSPKELLYIDDVSLVKDVMAAPTYFNEDFSTTTANWTFYQPNKYSISRDNYALRVTTKGNYSVVQSAPMKLKKGANYTVTLDLNISGVTDEKVNDGSNADNWINFSLSTEYKSYGSNSKGYLINETDIGTNKSLVATASNNSKSFDITYDPAPYCTHVGFSKKQAKDAGLNVDSAIKITISFRNDKDTVAYLNATLNGLGTYTIDNVKVEEIATNVDTTYLASKDAVKSLGTAIRTEGKQGMRFKTEVDKRLLTADMYYGIRVIEYGTVAIKTAYRGDTELVLDGMYDYGENTYAPKYGVAYSFADKKNLVYDEDKTSIDFTGVLMNIPESNWATDYTARAYFKYIDKNENTGVFYCDPADIDVYNVSKYAYSAKDANGSFVEAESVRQYLYSNIISKFSDKLIKIANNSDPIYSNFQGISSTVYHGVTFFPDSHGRTYTEEQAAVEMDRLVDTKVNNVRTRFDSNWAWTDNGWNWDSTKMQAFYDWGKMLTQRGISITIQAGWHLYDFIYFYNKNVAKSDFTASDMNAEGHSSIPEVNYLHGYADDRSTVASAKYGEDGEEKAGKIKSDARALGLNLTDGELAHYSVAAARYGEWISQGITRLKAEGINVQYVLPFTESGDLRQGDPTYSYDEWIIMTMGLNNALKDAGLRNNLKVIGPAQSLYANQNRLSLIEYVYNLIGNSAEYKNMIDINAMHQYTRPNYEAGYTNTVFDPEASYSMAEENFTYYDDVITNINKRNQEFWCDEYFAQANDAKWWNNIGMQMTQFAAGLTAGINNGVNRFLTWQMFDTLWDSDKIHGTAIHDNASEFSGGVHAVGTCPSLVHVDGKTCPNGASCPCTANYNISSYVPRTTYYGINLIGKYMNNNNASVYAAQVINKAADIDGGIYVSSIKNDAGKTVILVVNTAGVMSNVDIEFEIGNVSNLKRYVYNPEEIVPTAEAKSISSDKTITLTGDNSFRDTIPAGSFAIYVEGGNFVGDDVNIPWFN